MLRDFGQKDGRAGREGVGGGVRGVFVCVCVGGGGGMEGGGEQWITSNSNIATTRMIRHA